MLANLGMILFLSGPVFLFLALLNFIKKTGRGKIFLITGIITVITGFVLIGTTYDKEASDKAREERIAEKLEAEKEQEKLKQEKNEKKELDKKAKEEKVEAERKKKEEDKKVDKKAKETERALNTDITKINEEPTAEQISVLDQLTDQQFKQSFPYKGSKLHRVLGVIQHWTGKDGEWYYKAEATIVNAFGAEISQNVEVHITPETPTSGYVEFVNY